MGGSTIPKNDEQMVIHSGECSYKFKFRLIGLERINVLFNEIQDQVATFNKNTMPRNVTLFNEEAIKTEQVEERKIQKVTKWFKDKLGIHADDQNEDSHTSENISKYIKKSIQQQETKKPIKKYENSEYRLSLF